MSQIVGIIPMFYFMKCKKLRMKGLTKVCITLETIFALANFYFANVEKGTQTT